MLSFQKKAFTLIELLVVIAIISLLVSILLPSLQKAKELAHGVVCASKMRDFGTAGVLYISESDSWLPYAWEDTTPGYFWCAPQGWATTYTFDLNITSSNFTSTKWQEIAKKQNLYLCPSATNQDPQLYFDIYSYGMNVAFGMSAWNFPSRKVNELEQPYRTVMIIDTDGITGDGGTYYLAGGGSEAWSLSYSSRHLNGLNVLFADGRVEHKDAPLSWDESYDILWRF